MLQYLKKLFGKTSRARRAHVAARLALESLEARDVPSAVSGFAHGPAHFDGPVHVGAASTDIGVLKSTTTSTTQTLTASLTGITGAAGTATFTYDTSAGTNSFVLAVTGLTASLTYTVEIDGTTIGQVTTDATGSGSVTLTNLTVTVAVGSVISVVDTSTTPGATALSGSLGIGMGGGCQNMGAGLTAPLTGATGTSGSSSFSADATAGTNTLTVSVRGLTASSTYTVEIGAATVGTLTTDASGDGTASFSNITAAIVAGTTITILDANSNSVLSGTFATPVALAVAHVKHFHRS